MGLGTVAWRAGALLSDEECAGCSCRMGDHLLGCNTLLRALRSPRPRAGLAAGAAAGAC